MVAVFCIMFIAVAANHLGLIGAIEEAIGHKIPVVNCPRCLTFWLTIIYLAFMRTNPICIITFAFLFAYLAVWMDLAMGVIDYYYTWIYGKIYDNTDHASAASTTTADVDDTQSTMSDMQTNSDRKSHKKK